MPSTTPDDNSKGEPGRNERPRWASTQGRRRSQFELTLQGLTTHLAPYLLFGLLGKHVIHPGSRRATEKLLALAELAPGDRVLDIGCGVGTTAIEMARRFGVSVVAADISVEMRAGSG